MNGLAADSRRDRAAFGDADPADRIANEALGLPGAGAAGVPRSTAPRPRAGTRAQEPRHQAGCEPREQAENQDAEQGHRHVNP